MTSLGEAPAEWFAARHAVGQVSELFWNFLINPLKMMWNISLESSLGMNLQYKSNVSN